ncbi:MAG: hypothetical protein GF401_08765 [Chitinivibrionales bacterium]|nr:hypothetical protein [Chitinivibrionales bacterium]
MHPCMKTPSYSFSFFLPLFCFTMISPISSAPSTKAVKEIDFSKLSGTWYEIARFPNEHEKNMVNVTINIAIDNKKRKISITTKGNKHHFGGESVSFKARGCLPDKRKPAQLELKVFPFVSLDFSIIDIDTVNYHTFIASDDKGDCLWLFARKPDIYPRTLTRMIQSAQNKGYKTNKLIRTPHRGTALVEQSNPEKKVPFGDS